MPFIARPYIFLILAIALGGCGVRDTRFAPAGLKVAAPALPPDIARASTGLFSLAPSTDPALMCCWVAPVAHIFVRKTIPNAKSLTVGFYLPDSVKTTEHLSLTLKDGFTSTVDGTAGFNVRHIRLPRNRGIDGVGVRELDLKSSYRYSVDGKLYGVMLTSIYFE